MAISRTLPPPPRDATLTPQQVSANRKQIKQTINKLIQKAVTKATAR